MFVSVNLLNVRSYKVSKIVATFAAEAKDSKVTDLDSSIEELDKTLDKELHLTLSRDVLPWIGQYAGMGLTSLTFDQYGSPKEADWLAAIEARDQRAADAFLVKLQESVAESSGDRFKRTSYKGVTIYELDTTVKSERVAFARYGGLVLFGPEVASIHKAMDLRRNESLAGAPAYSDVINQLPRERALTVYVNGAQADKLMSGLSSSLNRMGPYGVMNMGVSWWRAGAVSLSVVEAGLQMDSVASYDLAKLSDDQMKMLRVTSKSKAADLFPENSLLFVTGQRPDLIWKAYREMLDKAAGATDIQESMNMLEKQYGVNPDKALFPYLDGELAIGMMPSSKGYLAVTSKTPLGAVALFETSNPNALQNTLTALNNNLKKQRMPVTESSSGGMVMYELQDTYSKSTMVAYGLNQNYLFMGSDSNIVKDVFAGGKPLSKSDRYQQVSRAFQSGMTLAMYVDLESLLATLRKGMSASDQRAFDETARYLKPVKFIAAGSSPLQGDTYRSTVIVFIQTK